MPYEIKPEEQPYMDALWNHTPVYHLSKYPNRHEPITETRIIGVQLNAVGKPNAYLSFYTPGSYPFSSYVGYEMQVDHHTLFFTREEAEAAHLERAKRIAEKEISKK